MSYKILNDLVLFFCQKNYFSNSLSIFDDDKLDGHSKNFKLDQGGLQNGGNTGF